MTPMAGVELGGQQREFKIKSAKVASPDGEFGDYEVYLNTDLKTKQFLTDGRILYLRRGKRESIDNLLLDNAPTDRVDFTPGVKIEPHFR
ncbi:MAG: hypothetical protein ACD_48C00025G0002 [uncultured bacterium]|nr:MAG: hypothetical protein ACD_48C00025G0002 [uncultured bacterium]